MSLNDLKLCKFVSRSDLVLDADHSLDYLSYLALEACISFWRFQREWRTSVFALFDKNAAAHVLSELELKKQFCRLCVALVFLKERVPGTLLLYKNTTMTFSP